VLDAAQQPLRSITWITASPVVVERDGGELTRTRRSGWDRFEHAVRRPTVK
jgi:transposase